MKIQTLNEKFTEYGTFFKGWTPDTIANAKSKISFFAKVTQVEDIENVSQDVVRSFFYFGRSRKKWKSSTYTTYYMYLSMFFQWCYRENYVPIPNLVKGIELPKKEKRLPKSHSNEQAQQLLDIVLNYPHVSDFNRYRDHAIYSTYLFCGLRKTELLKLNIADVDLEGLTLHVRGKGNKDRYIPIPMTLAISLKRYLKERDKRNSTSPAFFIGSRSGERLSEVTLDHSLYQIRKCVDFHFSWHTLRHTFAILMLRSGCNIVTLSKLMGHADIKTTMIYLWVYNEDLCEAMAKHPLNQHSKYDIKETLVYAKDWTNHETSYAMNNLT